ncbi:MAG: polyphenol oxidase family protein [Terriglobales bacterium]
MPAPLLLRAHNLSRLAWLRHGFGTRACGLRQPRVSIRPRPPLLMLRQIHSDLVWQDPKWFQAGDALFTRRPGPLLAIRTADCCPVLLADTRLRVVAAVHAGWRGTLARIAEKTVGEMRAAHHCRPDDMLAAIGPCIRRCCYQVGGDIQARFHACFGYAGELFDPAPDDPVHNRYPMLFMTGAAPGHGPQHETGPARGHEYDTHFNPAPAPRLDLQLALARQLGAAGLPSAAIEIIESCTRCQERTYFSHRRGDRGRMLSAIAIARAAK